MFFRSTMCSAESVINVQSINSNNEKRFRIPCLCSVKIEIKLKSEISFRNPIEVAKWMACLADRILASYLCIAYNPLCTGKKARKQGIHSGFQTQSRRHQKSETGVLVTPRKRLVYSKKHFKKLFRNKTMIVVV